MGSAALHCFSIFLLFIQIASGSGIDMMRPPSKSTIKQSMKYEIQETQRPFLYSDATTTIRDTPTTYPTMNPPDTTTPVVNPSPPSDTDTNPSPTTMAPPAFTPTTPTTAPTITPTTPTTTPTTPTTSPTTPTTSPTTPTTTPYTSPTTPTSSSGGGSWCVASSSASPTALQTALDYACGYGGADCSAIQPGASCYNPDTVKDHASYAFNSYYQKNPSPTSCAFGGAAQLTNTDPSSGSCQYPSSSSQSNTSTTPPTPPTTFTPPSPDMQSPPSPTIMTTPIGGSNAFGEGPAGSPNKAASMGQNSIIFLGTTIMLMYALFGIHP